MACSILIYVIPPPQTNQQTPRHVLDGPEIQRDKEENDDEIDDETGLVKTAEEVRYYCTNAEEKMEESCPWIAER